MPNNKTKQHFFWAKYVRLIA